MKGIPEVLADKNSHVHLVGIEGTGLSAIARVLLEEGYRVSGSDRTPGTRSANLRAMGAMIFAGHRPENVAGADLVLISSAIPEENPEVRAARESGIPVVKRAPFLGVLTGRKNVVAVAGTHGKTTTTAMISHILTKLKRDPSFIVGSVLTSLGKNAHAGKGPSFVVEADEYDHMFLGLKPDVAVITNVEWDHVDCYPTPEMHLQAFVDFLGNIPAGETAVVCAEDEGARTARKKTHRRDISWVEYGVAQGDWHAAQIFHAPAGGNLFLLIYPDGETPVQLPLSGRHNISNAVAAIAAAHHAEGIAPEDAADALQSFRGTERRFEIKGAVNDIVVVDDYAHHPTEIKATLQMARERYPHRELWAVFQPHTYTRTKALMKDFAASFSLADHVLVTDIYPAREKDDLGVSADQIVALMQHPDARYTGSLDETESILLTEIRPGSLLLTMGAGDGYLVGEKVLDALQETAK